jgi:argininosuccinate synthase
MGDVRRVVLAYSGGLDTSVILRWLIETYGCEVVCFVADVGQREDVDEAVEKAHATGAKDCIVRDLREEFVRDFVFPAVTASPRNRSGSPRRPGRMPWLTAAPGRATTRSGSS